MSSKDKLTKYTAYYRCPDKISNFKVRVRYKEVDDENITNKVEDWHTRIFSWREKSFSKSEKIYYGDINNCITDLEKKYHEKITKSNQNDFTVFTSVGDDCATDEEVNNGKLTYLQSFVERSEIFAKNEDEFDYTKSLNSSIENAVIAYDFEKMEVMADLGEYIENIWIKNERILCSIKYDKNAKILSIFPDFTTVTPYHIKVQGETSKHFYYFLENCCEKSSENMAKAENDLIKKLTQCKLSLRKQIVGDTFSLPPKNKLLIYLFFEILSAKNFEYSDIYIKFYIDLPEHWSCEDMATLNGVTQLCHGTKEENLVHFGHCFDITLEYNIQNLQEKCTPKSPYIYFEVFSKTSWERHRTEGLAYRNLPISNPGTHLFILPCFRLTSGLRGDLRRFFIGDCSNYKDVRWIGVPKEIETGTINKFGVNTVGTGELVVRLNVIHQSQAFLDEFNDRGDHRQRLIYEKLNSSSLIKSVEQVLQAFKRARRNMMEARKNV